MYSITRNELRAMKTANDTRVYNEKIDSIVKHISEKIIKKDFYHHFHDSSNDIYDYCSNLF